MNRNDAAEKATQFTNELTELVQRMAKHADALPQGDEAEPLADLSQVLADHRMSLKYLGSAIIHQGRVLQGIGPVTPALTVEAIAQRMYEAHSALTLPAATNVLPWAEADAAVQAGWLAAAKAHPAHREPAPRGKAKLRK